MATFTARLGLKRPGTKDKFRAKDFYDNWTILDSAPGRHVCTSGTRPTTWSTPQAGRTILETDTGLGWWFDGVSFHREGPKGLLNSEQITTDVSTTSTALVDAVSATVTIPAGGRSVLITVSGPGVYSTVDLTRLALFRGATQLQSWLSHGRLTGDADAKPHQVNLTFLDEAPASGAATYTLKYAAEPGYGGTSTLQAAIDAPLRLSVVEV